MGDQAVELTEDWRKVIEKIKELEIFLADDGDDFKKWLKDQSSKIKSIFKRSKADDKTNDDHFEKLPKLSEVMKEKMEIGDMMKVLEKFVSSGERRVVAGRVETFLTVVESAGEMVADTISSIFAPAPTCFRVIVLFVAGFQRRQGVVEGLNTLIDKFVPLFQRVDTRRDVTKSAAIQKLVMEQLGLFVEVCDYILKHRRNFWVAAADVVRLSFVEDDTLKGYQEQMDRALANENLQSTAEIYTMVAKGEQRSNLSIWRKTILGALDFGPADLVDSESPHDTGLGKLYKDPTEGTCLWMDDSNGAFARWAGGATAEADVSDGLLVLEGAPSSGKSHAMAGILSRLSKRETTGNMVAFCFGRDLLASAGREADAEQVRGLVVRSIVWQFAVDSSNEVVRSMAGNISRLRGFYGTELFRNNSLDQWIELLICNPVRKKMEKITFILIDGFESRMDAIAPLLEAAVCLGDSKLRIAVSSQPNDDFSSLCPTINIKAHSKGDIKAVVTFRMKSMPWSNGDGESVKAAKDRILDELPEKLGGDYAKLDAFVQRSRDARRLDDVEKALQEIDKPYRTQVESQIQSLVETLTGDEILELNEMITWVNSGLRELTVPEMEAVLQQRYPVDFWTLDERIKRLGERIRRVYSGLFDISPAGSVIWRPMVSDCIPKREEVLANGQGAQDEDKVVLKLIHEYLNMHLQLSITNADLGEPQRLLRKSSPIGKRDPANDHLEIALTCLKACKSSGSRTGILRYVRMFLFDHLKKISENLPALNKKQKQEAGPLLLDLFRDGNAIDAMFWFHGDMSINQWDISEGKELNEVRRRWLYTPDGVNLLRTLLRDKDWASKVTGDQHSSEAYVVPQGQDTDTAHEREMLLSNIAKRIARKIFLDGGSVTRGYRTGVNFLSGFLYLLPKHNQWRFTRPYRADEAEWLAADKEKSLFYMHINALEGWVKDTLFPDRDNSQNDDDSETDDDAQAHDKYGESMYNAQMGCVVESFLEDGRETSFKAGVAKRFFNRALEIDDGNTLACLHLSRYVKGEERIKRLELGRTDAHGGEGGLDNKRVMAYLLCELGNRYWKEGKKDSAVEAHNKSLERDCTIFNAYEDVLKTYIGLGDGLGYDNQEGWKCFVLFLGKIASFKDDWKQYLDTMVWHLLVPFSGRTMALAVESTNVKSWECIEGLYNTALELADKQKYFEIKFLAYQSFAYTLSFAVFHDEGNKKAILNLEKAVEFGKKLGGVSNEEGKTVLRISDQLISHAGEQLARLYLHRLLELRHQGHCAGEVDNVRRRFLARVAEQNTHQENTTLSCYLARWHKADGKSKEDQINAVKHLVEEAEAMLLDDTPTNDQQAWESLFQVAVTLGQRKIASNIREFLYVYHFATRAPEDEDNPETLYVCDKCGKGISVNEDVETCQDCAGEAMFHSDCAKSLGRLCTRHDRITISSSVEAEALWGFVSIFSIYMQGLKEKSGYEKEHGTEKEVGRSDAKKERSGSPTFYSRKMTKPRSRSRSPQAKSGNMSKPHSRSRSPKSKSAKMPSRGGRSRSPETKSRFMRPGPPGSRAEALRMKMKMSGVDQVRAKGRPRKKGMGEKTGVVGERETTKEVLKVVVAALLE